MPPVVIPCLRSSQCMQRTIRATRAAMHVLRTPLEIDGGNIHDALRPAHYAPGPTLRALYGALYMYAASASSFSQHLTRPNRPLRALPGTQRMFPPLASLCGPQDCRSGRALTPASLDGPSKSGSARRPLLQLRAALDLCLGRPVEPRAGREPGVHVSAPTPYTCCTGPVLLLLLSLPIH